MGVRLYPLLIVAVAAMAGCTPAPNPEDGSDTAANAAVGSDNIWWGGDLYVVDVDLDQQSRYTLDSVIVALSANTPIRVHLVENDTYAPEGKVVWVSQNRTSTNGLSEALGTATGWVVSTFASLGHEFGHVLGLAHTQQRIDRDEYVVIHDRYISEEMAPWFQKNTGWPHIGPYDLDSVMHYCTFTIGDSPCSAMTRLTETSSSPDECIEFNDLAVDDPRYLPFRSAYSPLDYAVLSALYCDPRYCGDRCADADRCGAPAVQDNLATIAQWEYSEEGQAWRAAHPDESR